MNAIVTDLSAVARIAPAAYPSMRIESFLKTTRFDRPTMTQRSKRRHPMPQIMAEPGRGMFAEAGMIVAGVLLESRKSDDDRFR